MTMDVEAELRRVAPVPDSAIPDLGSPEAEAMFTRAVRLLEGDGVGEASTRAPVSRSRAPRRPPRLALAGAASFVVLAVLVLVGQPMLRAVTGVTKGANDQAGESNLQTALTGAKAYFASNHDSYSGILSDDTGVSSLQQLGTGVSYTAGASSGRHTVSARAYDHGQAVVLMALVSGTGNCWGILEIATPLPQAELGETQPGTYFFVSYSVASGKCSAADPVAAAISTAGFAQLHRTR